MRSPGSSSIGSLAQTGITRLISVFVFMAFALGGATVASAKAPVIALIDSGVDGKHSAFASQLVAGFDFTEKDSYLEDNVGHGTAMASIIAGSGKVHGQCPQCRIMPLKVTDSLLVPQDRIAQAIRYAVNQGVQAIYVGAGSMEVQPSVVEAVKMAEDNGTLVIAPAGPRGLSEPLYPAALETVISVVGISELGKPLYRRNFSGKEMILAEGTQLNAAKPGGGTTRVMGSSVAAARVAGSVGQLLAQDGRLPPVHVRQALRFGTAAPSFSDGTLAQRIIQGPVRTAIAGPHRSMARLQYADGPGVDIVIDAPWKTIRDYVPVLFFFPEFDDLGSRKNRVLSIELFNYNLQTKERADLIFRDTNGDSDEAPCAGVTFIDPSGASRLDMRGINLLGFLDLTIPEVHGSFWHYIARVPVDCIGTGTNKGQPGTHYLEGLVHWIWETDNIQRPDHPFSGKEASTHSFSRKETSTRVLRVIVDSTPFPKFDPIDRYYDIHVHTIAEQTPWPWDEVDAARKAFGGPIAMLLESAYALGLVDTQLHNGNWDDFRNQIATTDHNVFYSRDNDGHYDAGIPPAYGPTASTDGHFGEFLWYRWNFGTLGGEEVTLEGHGKVRNSDKSTWVGSHFLTYGAPHFEGPWHGGRFNPRPLGIDVGDDGAPNPNTLSHVLEVIGNAAGFGYAAHPYGGIAWPKDYFELAIGFPPHNDDSPTSLILQKDGRDFIFKGSQVWNEKHDEVARENGRIDAEELQWLNPFGGRDDQTFLPNPDWDTLLQRSLSEYYKQVRQGLNYAFKQQPDHKFIRKIYMSAGTDAHGDFNYLDSLHSTAEAQLGGGIVDLLDWPVDDSVGSITSNAFGRVRTYTLTGERPDADEGNELVASVNAYEEGNTVLTDGPICKFSIDSDCRHNPELGVGRWHDAGCQWENPDGQIGGYGAFDGGKTALVPHPGGNLLLNSLWKGHRDMFDGRLNPHYAMDYHMKLINSDLVHTFTLPAGETDMSMQQPLGKTVGLGSIPNRYFPHALIMNGKLSTTIGDSTSDADAQCITNPVWLVPVKISMITHPNTCPIPAGGLKVSFQFGISMDTTAPCLDCICAFPPCYSGAKAYIQPLDSSGDSASPVTRLQADPGWLDNHLAGPSFPVINDASFTVSNAQPVACPGEYWDTDEHRNVWGKRSYVVYVKDLRDMHGNPLNDVGKAFSITRYESPTPIDQVR